MQLLFLKVIFFLGSCYADTLLVTQLWKVVKLKPYNILGSFLEKDFCTPPPSIKNVHSGLDWLALTGLFTCLW